MKQKHYWQHTERKEKSILPVLSDLLITNGIMIVHSKILFYHSHKLKWECTLACSRLIYLSLFFCKTKLGKKSPGRSEEFVDTTCHLGKMFLKAKVVDNFRYITI